MTRKIVGIRDIAREAGVSVATVSRVINTPEKTKQETREKVNEIINKYNYVPNALAKNLFAKKSTSFAIFIYDVSNPFFISLVKELTNFALDNQCSLLVCDTENNPEKEIKYINYCESIQTHGIILTEGLVSHISSKNINQKLIFLDRALSDKYSIVTSDNEKGISMIVDYLVRLNHRKIAFVGDIDKFSTSRIRYNTFHKKMEKTGLFVPKNYVFNGPFTPQTGEDAMIHLMSLPDPPTAIVCANDLIAYGMTSKAAELDLKIPGDFSITGFDGCMPSYLIPKVTTVAQNTKELAEKLFEAVFIADKPKEYIVDVSLKIGNTCGRRII